MKRIALAALALALAPLASAQLYKWVDKDGKVSYSDQPPPAAASKQIKVETGGSGPAPSAVARDKELQKGRQEAADAQKKKDDAERVAKQREEECEKSRSYLKGLENGGRFVTFDDKGNRTFLEADQIEAEKTKARKNVEEACKPS